MRLFFVFSETNSTNPVNVDDYHIVDSVAGVVVISGIAVGVHAFHLCVYCFDCTVLQYKPVEIIMHFCLFWTLNFECHNLVKSLT